MLSLKEILFRGEVFLRGLLSTLRWTCSPPGVRGSSFIVPSSEREPLDQTNIDWTVILDPLGRWSLVSEKSSDWSPGQGGRPRGEGGRPAHGPVRPPVRSRGVWSLLDDRKLRCTLISLCNLVVWAFIPYFLITPCRNRQTPKLVEFCQIKP